MNTGTCRWVSVEERLPNRSKHEGDCSVDVFVMADDEIKEDSSYYDFADREWVFYPTVTHWLEVIAPDPPKKKVKREKEIFITLREDGEIDQVYHNYPPAGRIRAKVTYEVEE